MSAVYIYVYIYIYIYIDTNTHSIAVCVSARDWHKGGNYIIMSWLNVDLGLI